MVSRSIAAKNASGLQGIKESETSASQSGRMRSANAVNVAKSLRQGVSVPFFVPINAMLNIMVGSLKTGLLYVLYAVMNLLLLAGGQRSIVVTDAGKSQGGNIMTTIISACINALLLIVSIIQEINTAGGAGRKRRKK